MRKLLFWYRVWKHLERDAQPAYIAGHDYAFRMSIGGPVMYVTVLTCGYKDLPDFLDIIRGIAGGWDCRRIEVDGDVAFNVMLEAGYHKDERCISWKRRV